MRSRTRCRKAFTLMELGLVVSLLGLILSLAATMLGLSYRMYSRTIERGDFTRSLETFAQRLRADAHAARSVETLAGGESSGIRLKMVDGSTISYLSSPSEVQRQVSGAGGVSRRDHYRLADCQVTLSISDQVPDGINGSLITAEVKSSSSHPMTRPLETPLVQAAVGFHHSRPEPGADE